MAMTPKEYDKMLKESSPPTRSGRSLPMAFVVGGLICVVGQALTQCYLSLGLGREEAGAWCSVTLIFLSVLTTGLGWYQRLAKYAGAGTLVPITGFANAMSSPAIEFKSEGMVLGLAASLKSPKDTKIYARDGLAIVALVWVLMSVFGALPFVISGEIPSRATMRATLVSKGAVTTHRRSHSACAAVPTMTAPSSTKRGAPAV